jgi:hypothetical protein
MINYKFRGPPTSYGMDYIGDKQLFAAVMFARRMIHEGTSPGIAITRAANYHEMPVRDVARYVGQAARNTQLRRQASMQSKSPPDTW